MTQRKGKWQTKRLLVHRLIQCRGIGSPQGRGQDIQEKNTQERRLKYVPQEQEHYHSRKQPAIRPVTTQIQKKMKRTRDFTCSMTSTALGCLPLKRRS